MSEREGKFYPASSSIPWRQVVATRNRLIHGYPGRYSGVVARVEKVKRGELVD
jgi:uncharacterized protein with HEPN domain